MSKHCINCGEDGLEFHLYKDYICNNCGYEESEVDEDNKNSLEDQALNNSSDNDIRLAKVDSIRAKMISTITHLFAAEFIAKSEFPQKNELPELLPPPFNNFGHQSLLDDKLLLNII